MVILSIHHQLNIILGICGLILILGLLLKRLNLPYIIAYILTGICLGPYGWHLIEDQHTAEVVGELGLVVLMFFIGMEISLKDFISKWKIAMFGTGMQVVFSVVMVFILGLVMDWSFKRILLLGFIISLSSSAVVIKLIEDHKLGDLKIGQNVISILLTQDILIVPMIILMSLVGGGTIEISSIILQLAGGVLIVFLLVYLLKKQHIKLPFEAFLRFDHELQVFAAMIVCFGFAFLTSLFQLSAGLGAFVAGLLVHASPATKWLHDSLHSFRVVLISIFFISIGMLIDINFLMKNWLIIGLLVVGVLLSNHGINAISLRSLGNSWGASFIGGALLAQIGEFSYVLASLGYQSEIISPFTYQLTILVISITILLSPIWVMMTKLLPGVKRDVWQ